jgi:hypothetical protein
MVQVEVAGPAVKQRFLFTTSTMARSAAVHDVFMLFGDSITQGAWDVGYNGVGQRLSREFAYLSGLADLKYG